MTEPLDNELDALDPDQGVVEDTEITLEQRADEATQDAIDDGDDLAVDLDDSGRAESRLDGVVPLDEEIVTDDETTSETIEDRIQQEVPDPNSSIVPPDAGRRA